MKKRITFFCLFSFVFLYYPLIVEASTRSVISVSGELSSSPETDELEHTEEKKELYMMQTKQVQLPNASGSECEFVWLSFIIFTFLITYCIKKIMTERRLDRFKSRRTFK